MFVVVGRFLGGGVKAVSGGGTVEEETGGTGRDVMLHPFQCYHVKIEQVTW